MWHTLLKNSVSNIVSCYFLYKISVLCFHDTFPLTFFLLSHADVLYRTNKNHRSFIIRNSKKKKVTLSIKSYNIFWATLTIKKSVILYYFAFRCSM